MKKLILIFTLLIPVIAYASPFVINLSGIDRDIYMNGEVDDAMAMDITRQLKDMDSHGHAPITIHITSPGGSVYSGLQIYDIMSTIKSPIITRCEGYCMSMAAVILAAGTEREALPNATILVHGIAIGGVGGKLPAIFNELQEAVRLQAIMDAILVARTGKTLTEVQTMESYDHYMSAQDAVNNGLIDRIIGH